MLSPDSPIITPSTISYCSVINAAPTSYDALYTLVNTACCITRKSGHIILVLDQGIYIKALEIAHDKSEEFRFLILHMDGFHILTAIFILRKCMEVSWFEDTLIESNVFFCGWFSDCTNERESLQ